MGHLTTRFGGESPWDALVNDNSLDIEEEDAFTRFMAAQGFHAPKILPLEVLERLLSEWYRAKEGL